MTGQERIQVFNASNVCLAIIPDAYWELESLPRNVIHTFRALASFAWGKKYGCWPSIEAIAKRVRFSRSTVERHLDILESLHIIKRIRRPRTSDYYILCHKLKPNFQDAIKQCLASLPPHARAKLTMKEWRIIIKHEHLCKRISRGEYRAMVKDTRVA